MAFELQNRVVFITGASSGIGRACAVAFHLAGARVAAAARSTDKLEALCEELGSDRVLPVTMDVTDAQQREAGLGLIREHFGPVDVLVNNAGWASFTSVLKMPAEHMERMIALNLAAPVALIQAVLPEMVERGHGQIINIASVVGFQPIPRMTFYSATKAALVALSTGLRMELAASGVDVIMVAPGSTDTPFFDTAASVDARASGLMRMKYPPQRVARAVVRASRRRQREVILTTPAKAIILIRRGSRRLADAIMYKIARRAMPVVEARPGLGDADRG